MISRDGSNSINFTLLVYFMQNCDQIRVNEGFKMMNNTCIFANAVCVHPCIISQNDMQGVNKRVLEGNEWAYYMRHSN